MRHHSSTPIDLDEVISMHGKPALFLGASRRVNHRRSLLVPRLAAMTILAIALASPTRSLANTLVSEDLGGSPAGGAGLNRNPGSTQDVSPDGRYVVFTSSATDLVTGVTDTNSAADLFLRDRVAGTTAILSVDAAGNALGYNVANALFALVFSPDSRHLLFRTQAANFVAGLADTNNAPDWFVRDLETGSTTCITSNAARTATGNVTSFTADPPVFSPDGGSIAFISLASDLVAGISDGGGRDLFLFDLEAGTTEILSLSLAGEAAGLVVDDRPSFSPDGRYIAFLSMAPDMVAGVTDTNNFTDLFVRDTQTDTTFLVNRGVDDAAALLSRYTWTADGQAIVFTSPGTNLVAGIADTNNGDDVFSWDVDSHVVEILSVDPAGTAAGDKVSRDVSVGPESRYVAFGSASTNLTPESAGGDIKDDLYVRDMLADNTAYVARNDSSSVVVGFVSFSPDGEHLFFKSDATGIVAGLADTNGEADLFRYRLTNGTFEAVTINAAGTATANSQSTSSDDVVVSPDGRYVSFVSDAHDLVDGVTTSSSRDLFVRDLAGGQTRLVTAGLGGEGVGYDQFATRDAEFSPDSAFLVFTNNLLLRSQVTEALNFNFATNLYAFDVAAGVQTLLTTNAAGTAPANGGLSGPFETGVEPFSFIVNPAGGSVFFVATFTDMVAGVSDPSATPDLFEATLPVPEPAAGVGEAVAVLCLGFVVARRRCEASR
jgi:Tol biopolymer transport system component